MLGILNVSAAIHAVHALNGSRPMLVRDFGALLFRAVIHNDQLIALTQGFESAPKVSLIVGDVNEGADFRHRDKKAPSPGSDGAV